MKPSLVALVLALSGALLGTGLAHSELTSSTPANGETLGAAPAEVMLNFSEGVETPFSTFKVYPLGTDVAETAEDAAARISGLAGQLVSEVLEARGDEAERANNGLEAEGTTDTVSLPLKPDLGAGVYVVMWRILSVDSHTSQGFVTFRIAP